jgi:zinc-binding alcohol dehydrogenase/oxidoreductase
VVLGSEAADPVSVWSDWPDPMTAPGWVTVRVLAAGLNRNDALNVAGRLSREAPSIIGADGSGVVVEVSAGVVGWKVGDEVVVLPTLWWGDNESYPSSRFEVLGDTTSGTFAEFVSVPAENVFRAPERLSSVEAGVLPLAGVTAWRALITRGRLKAGQRLLVTGGSGGVATFAVQIGNAIGAEVEVTTSSLSKLARAVDIGASGGVVREEGWETALLDAGPFDVVLDSSGANWPQLVESLVPGGTLVSIGRTINEHAQIPIHQLFIGQRHITGSTMGSPREFGALLTHIDESDWVPLVDSTFGFAEPSAAFNRLDQADRIGKVAFHAAE